VQICNKSSYEYFLSVLIFQLEHSVLYSNFSSKYLDLTPKTYLVPKLVVGRKIQMLFLQYLSIIFDFFLWQKYETFEHVFYSPGRIQINWEMVHCNINYFFI